MAQQTADVVAVDLGASSGRVMLGHAGPGVLELTEVTRFANRPVQVAGRLYWDILALYAGAVDGIRAAARAVGTLDGIGVDSWAVDYGLLDQGGQLLGNPVHYRDHRTDGVLDKVVADLGADFLYQRTGLQLLPINTIYQLASARETAALRVAERLLLVPDLMNFWLTGRCAGELTNASTTGLLDIRSRRWSAEICDGLGLDIGLLPALQEPGTQVGTLLAEVHHVAATTPVPVWAVGSHDTASAVVGVPAQSDRFAYISCGTWSLVGLELDRPVLTEASRRANFTNELGVDGTVRYLRNVMGLWLLQESLRTWEEDGDALPLDRLLREAAGVPAMTLLIDPDDPDLLPSGDMPSRIADACRRRGQRAPETPAETVRCILDSLALAYRATVRRAQELAGRDVDVVHLVGGGARNELLCQLTADACGLPVEAGPVEAAALGNVLVQARAVGTVPSELAGMRTLLRRTQSIRRYEPSGSGSAWDDAERRLHAVHH
jgi:rhamnulokinase